MPVPLNPGLRFKRHFKSPNLKSTIFVSIEWQKVSKPMITAIVAGASVSYNQTANGLNIQVQVVNPGCGKGHGSGTVFYVRGDWTHIRYTQEFYGSATCWKIFGTTASPKYRWLVINANTSYALPIAMGFIRVRTHRLLKRPYLFTVCILSRQAMFCIWSQHESTS